jgi:predicted nucleic acid-binding protein
MRVVLDTNVVVSGDPHLLRLGEYRGVQIVPPATFLMVLQQQP